MHSSWRFYRLEMGMLLASTVELKRLKCNKDENETVIAHRSDCGLFCPKIERSNLL